MDERQDQAFQEAVERKKAEAKQRSEAHESRTGPPPAERELPQQQRGLIDDGTPQDTMSARDKSQGKGKKTADKWNQ